MKLMPDRKAGMGLALACAFLAACGGSDRSTVASTTPTAMPSPTPSPTPSPVSGNWQLVWADEFDGTTLDAERWTALEDCWGGGNEERQCYTPRTENVALENGRLILTARREQWTGPAWPRSFGPSGTDPNETRTKPFTSGKITSEGLESWTFGRFEIRARFPQGQGVWPAFWMLPERNFYGPWAASGEIDILEIINPGVECDTCEHGGENSIYGTLHFGGQWPDNDSFSQDHSFPGLLDGEFHTYGVIWEQGRFIWTVDGESYAEMTSDHWYSAGGAGMHAPFDRPFHLIVNLAIGGRWPEDNALGGVSAEGFPKRMEVDWVRVWQCDADSSTGRGCAGDD